MLANMITKDTATIDQFMSAVAEEQTVLEVHQMAGLADFVQQSRGGVAQSEGMVGMTTFLALSSRRVATRSGVFIKARVRPPKGT